MIKLEMRQGSSEVRALLWTRSFGEVNHPTCKEKPLCSSSPATSSSPPNIAIPDQVRDDGSRSASLTGAWTQLAHAKTRRGGALRRACRAPINRFRKVAGPGPASVEAGPSPGNASLAPKRRHLRVFVSLCEPLPPPAGPGRRKRPTTNAFAPSRLCVRQRGPDLAVKRDPGSSPGSGFIIRPRESPR